MKRMMTALYGPGTQHPTLSPCHENYVNEPCWYDAIADRARTAVYSLPNDCYPTVAQVPRDEVVSGYYWNEDFYYCEYEGVSGFIHSEYLF